MEETFNKLSPTKSKIIFTFMEDISGGKFDTKTESGIIIAQKRENQLEKARWGKVLSIGPDVETVEEGQYILVEPLMWTNALEYDSLKFWVTEEEKILAITTEEPKSY